MTKTKPETQDAASAAALPFKLMLCDGPDWVVVTPTRQAPFCGPTITADMRAAFKDFHGRRPSRAARLYIIPPSYVRSEGGLTVSMNRAEWSPVEVR